MVPVRQKAPNRNVFSSFPKALGAHNLIGDIRLIYRKQERNYNSKKEGWNVWKFVQRGHGKLWGSLLAKATRDGP